MLGYHISQSNSYTIRTEPTASNSFTMSLQDMTTLVNSTASLSGITYDGYESILAFTASISGAIVGEHLGADVTAGTIQTGGALGDLYGYSVTFTGMEQLPAAFLSGSTTTSPFAGLTSQPTIVYS